MIRQTCYYYKNVSLNCFKDPLSNVGFVRSALAAVKDLLTDLFYYQWRFYVGPSGAAIASQILA